MKNRIREGFRREVDPPLIWGLERGVIIERVLRSYINIVVDD